MKEPYLIIGLLALLLLNCKNEPVEVVTEIRTRPVSDTVGYAHTPQQMDSIIQRINRMYGRDRENILYIHHVKPEDNWNMVICPHDDYQYAGQIYTFVLENVKTPLVLIFGVAHRAKDFNIQDRLVFDSYDQWQGPYGPIPVSPIREDIIAEIPEEYFVISDSLHQVEQSVEALLPFIQYYQPDVQIIPVLVPYMDYPTMEKYSVTLATAIFNISQRRKLTWSKDFALVISNDCVHYGDEGWDNRNYAIFGADTMGFQAATNHDMNIISECLIDQLEPQGIRRFFEYTVDVNDYKEYSWTWCGRYSVPFGLLTGYNLQILQGSGVLTGKMLRYSTSISGTSIPVDDIGLGVTAPANIRHWVGYVALGFTAQ